MKRRLSIVVPVYNEEDILPRFLSELSDLLDRLNAIGFDTQVVFNDNASTDGSAVLLKAFNHRGSDVLINTFARNYGFQESILYGLNVAQGDCVVVLQSDLQDPPELILDMVAAWEAGFLTVGARPIERAEGWLITMVRKAYYSLTSVGSGNRQARGVLDFYLLDRVVVNELKSSAYQGVFLRGWIAQTFDFRYVLFYRRAPRTGGVSKFRFEQLYEIGMNGILIQSRRFIRLLAIGGVALAMASIVGLLTIGVLWTFGVRTPLSGWFSLTSFILVLLGINSLGFALVFEFLSRVSAIVARPSVPQVLEKTQRPRNGADG